LRIARLEKGKKVQRRNDHILVASPGNTVSFQPINLPHKVTRETVFPQGVFNKYWTGFLTKNNKKENNMKLKENQYILSCVKTDGSIQTFIPFYGSRGGSNLFYETGYCSLGERENDEWVFDYRELVKWVKENLYGKYVKVIISRVSDAIEFQTKSVVEPA